MGGKKISTTPTQNRILDSWYLLGVLFKISDEHPRLFKFLYGGPDGAASSHGFTVFLKLMEGKVPVSKGKLR